MPRPIDAGPVTESVAEPGERSRGEVDVFGHEVPRPLEAMHVGVRQPADEVVEVAVGEDRVAGAPQHQCRHREGAQRLGDAPPLGLARVAFVGGDVGDEAADAAAALGASVGRAVGLFDVEGQGRMRERERRLEKGRCRDGRLPEHAPTQGEPERGGDLGIDDG